MTSNPKTFAAAAMLLSAIPATAGTTIPSLVNPEPVATSDSGWQCRVALYGWGTALDGDVTIRGHNAPVDLSFGDVLDHLDMALTGLVEVGYDRWSFLADFFHAEISPGNSVGNRVFSAELDQFIGNFAVAYDVTSHGVLAGLECKF